MATLLYHWNFTGENNLSVDDVIRDDKENLSAALKSRGTITTSNFSRGSDGIDLSNTDASFGGFYIDLDGLDNVNLGGNISIEMAVKNNNRTIKAIYFLSVGENASGDNQAFVNARYNGKQNKMFFGVRTDEKNNGVSYTERKISEENTTVIDDGDEHHYIFSINCNSSTPSSSTLDIYIDGESKVTNNTVDLEKALTTNARSTNFIGTRKNVDDGTGLTYLNGVVKYLKIYQNAMSGSQASTIYNNYNNAPYLSNISAATNEAKHTARHSLNFPTGVTSFSVSGNQLGLSNGNEDYKILKFVASSNYNISDSFNYVPLEGENAFIIINHETILYKITQTSSDNGVNAEYKLEVSLDSGSSYTTECTDKGFGSTYDYNNITLVFGGVEFVVNSSDPICFHKDTLIETDQGLVKITDLKNYHTIENSKIIYVLKSPNKPNKLVLIKKNAFGDSMPSKDVIVTRNHTIILNDKIVFALNLVNDDTIKLINNDDTDVYNIFLLNKRFINVCNLSLGVIHVCHDDYNKLKQYCNLNNCKDFLFGDRDVKHEYRNYTKVEINDYKKFAEI